ncbi:VCBS repeat-containing protein [Maioricimonas sp. JC845]|uniref:FG-GAP repeat domain-containing protein n=1 Tax=Maioricimonas sp. JC845 TaxID=3232138 RepID=UPI003458C588
MRLLAAWLLLSTVAFAADPAAPWPRHTIDDSSRGADGVRLADVNGDRRFDITTGWEEGGRIRAYLHPGPEAVREAWPAVTVGNVKSPEDAVFADLDGDGLLDIISSCEGRTRTLYFHFSPSHVDNWLDESDWRTVAVPALQDQQQWMFCLPLDVDGENGIDLIVGSKGKGASVGWLRSPADPRDAAAWTWHPLDQAGWIMSLIAEDMDGDGDLDILLSDRKGKQRGIRWLENPGPSGTTWNRHLIGAEDREIMFITLGDIDGDGMKDIAGAARGDSLLLLRRKSPDATDWDRHEIAMPDDVGTGKGVGIGDVDRDGRTDLVVSCEHSEDRHGLFWLSYRTAFNDSSWDFHPISGAEQGIKFDLVELIDLDEDGDLDVLTCEERDNLGVIWYENPASGQ